MAALQPARFKKSKAHNGIYSQKQEHREFIEAFEDADEFEACKLTTDRIAIFNAQKWEKNPLYPLTPSIQPSVCPTFLQKKKKKSIS